MDTEKELQAWEEVKKKSRFSHAFRGLHVFWNSTRNAKIHMFLGILAVILGIYFCISILEWLAIVFAIGFVFITEILNTAIEIDIDLTSPQYHPFARDTKDVAAGAVLLASFVAFLVGAIIFIPKILSVL